MGVNIFAFQEFFCGRGCFVLLGGVVLCVIVIVVLVIVGQVVLAE